MQRWWRGTSPLKGLDGQVVAHQVEEHGSPVADRKIVDNHLDDHELGYLRW